MPVTGANYSATTKPTVLIYNNHLLNYSETFVRAQGQALSEFDAFYLGSYAVPGGLNLPSDRCYVLRQQRMGTLSDIIFKLGGVPYSLARLAKDQQASLIHAHFGPNGMSALNLARHLDIPLATTFHGFDITISNPSIKLNGWLHVYYKARLKRLIAQGDRFIAVSDFIANKLSAAGFPEDKICRHYIGIDTGFFCPDLKQAREPIVLQVGRLVPYKGQALLIEAMTLVQSIVPDVRLVLVGDGPERERLEVLARRLKVNIEFTGKQTPEQVRAWLRRAMVYTQTSTRLSNGHEEALALSIVEAQAVGTPAVVFNSGGMPETLLDGTSGYVVPEADIDQLADAILSLVDDSVRWRHFSSAAITYARSHHCLATQCHSLESIYKDMLNMGSYSQQGVALHESA